MASIFLDSVSKRFPGGTKAVDDLSLNINDREFVVLVGPSGCGKSTLLRLIAGLETLSSGEIRIGDHDVGQLPAKDRDIAMVFQDDALYPDMSVYGNLSFGLRLRYGGGVIARGLRKIFQPGRYRELSSLRRGIDEKVRQAADRLGITGLLDQLPRQLSGGERQRVALGRALVRNPAAFLLDEPLSNLDALLRRGLRVELKRLHHELGATILYVTHDQVEAMTLGDRIAVMNGGKILQVGRPLDVYQRPANLFVAQFIGNVPMNLMSGTVKQESAEIRLADQTLNIGLTAVSHDEQLRVGLVEKSGPFSVVVGFRAEDGLLKPVDWDDASCTANKLGRMSVMLIERFGDSTLVYVSPGRSGSNPQASREQKAGQVGPVSFHESLHPSNLDRLAIRTAVDAEWKLGDSVDVWIEPARLVWFDAETGNRIGSTD